MKRTWIAIAVVLFCGAVLVGGPTIMSKLMPKQNGYASPTPADEKGQPKDDLSQRIAGSFTKAADWLVKQQGEDGMWRIGKYPSTGYTALVAYALAGAPEFVRKQYDGAVNKAVAQVLKKQNDDGSFSELQGANKSYVSSVVVMLLVTLDKEKHKEPIKKVEAFLVQAQAKKGVDKGGSGYGDVEIKIVDGKPQIQVQDKADLSNTSFVIEALEKSGLSAESEYYQYVAEFLSKLQQNSETNTDPEYLKLLAERGIRIGDDGGFVYSPFESKAGEVTGPDGTKTMKTYASMTYAGLKSLIYAHLKKEDPRVQAAMKWIKKNYTLEINAGFGVDEVKRTHLQGLFYYYMSFAKALNAYAEATLETEDGKKHEWARDLAEKLLTIQKAAEGQAWTNENPRWGESDPVLTTSYVLIAYNTVSKWIK